MYWFRNLTEGMRILAYTAGAILAGATAAYAQVADTIYTNGRVYTVDASQPWAEAVAIEDGKFIAVGSAKDVGKFADKDTRIVDLKGKMILPGFFDSHIHLENFYVSQVIADKLFTIPPATSTKEIAASIRKFAEKYPKLELIFGTNLTDELFPGSSPTRQFLDEIVPDRPVIIKSIRRLE